MDRRVLDYLMRKHEEDSERGGDGRRGRDMRDNRGDSRGDRRGDSRGDSRRGVRRYRRRRDYDERDNDYRDYDERDYDETDYDSRDYDERDYDERDYEMRDGGHKKLHLNRTDMTEWKRMMKNADNSTGAHYDMQEIMQAAERANIRFADFDEKEFCLVVNMMYSDYCKVVKKHIAPEKELPFFVDLARAFLEDDDGPEPSEKLALYYHCIVKSE